MGNILPKEDVMNAHRFPAQVISFLLALTVISVSYTHLDVYKRQDYTSAKAAMDRLAA